ncbi:MAG: NAD(P)H-dependent oxidoreductase subunit E [Candidatus Aegiribacteria sp.]|nr:NAD(P)H-dependent oxidoreductase subunit E [Candidatus Aegiribacteria sp.]
MSANTLASVEEIVGKYDRNRSQLMNIVRDVQDEMGYISEQALQSIAGELGIHRVEVQDMVSFYHLLSRRPQGKTVIRLCNAVVEKMHGMEDVAVAFEKAVGVPFGSTSDDGAISLEYTSCIGMSDQAPAALVNSTVVPNLKVEDVPGLIESIRKGDYAKRMEETPLYNRVENNLIKSGEVIFAPMEHGAAIRAAINKSPEDVINEINISRLRGRGGAGFPTAMKWDFCRKAKGEAHYVICNADEGEPGTFKDRVILTEVPDLLFEGMTIAGYAIGAESGTVYLRGEYEYLYGHLQQVLYRRRHLGLLGENICGKEGFNFDISIQLGAGAYVCGEESSLIESLEGKRGAPRDRPPFPVTSGYFNQPTSVNNVETLCCAARILEKGGEWFTELGTRDSTGTKLLSISGDCPHPGVYEVEYGLTVDDILSMVDAEDAQAVQVGGASGSCIAPKDYGRSISFEDLPTGGSIMVFGQQRDLLQIVREFTEFFVEESCGWCAPCRVGTTLLLKYLDKILQGHGAREDLVKLKELGNTITMMSRCGLGQTAANPVLTTLKDFASLYNTRINDTDAIPLFDFEKAIAMSSEITGHQSTVEVE